MEHEHTIVKDFIAKPLQTNSQSDSGCLACTGKTTNKQKKKGKKTRADIKMNEKTSENNGRKCARQTICQLSGTVIDRQELSDAGRSQPHMHTCSMKYR